MTVLLLGRLAQHDVLEDPVFDPTPVSGWTVVLAVGVVLGLLLLGALAWCWVRSAREDPADRAFRLLAAHLRLSRGARGLVRNLAHDSGVAPVGLLVSPRALAARLGSLREPGGLVDELAATADSGAPAERI